MNIPVDTSDPVAAAGWLEFLKTSNHALSVLHMFPLNLKNDSVVSAMRELLHNNTSLSHLQLDYHISHCRAVREISGVLEKHNDTLQSVNLVTCCDECEISIQKMLKQNLVLQHVSIEVLAPNHYEGDSFGEAIISQTLNSLRIFCNTELVRKERCVKKLMEKVVLRHPSISLESLAICGFSFIEMPESILLLDVLSMCKSLKSLDLSRSVVNESFDMALSDLVRYSPGLEILRLRSLRMGKSPLTLDPLADSLMKRSDSRLSELDITYSYNGLPEAIRSLIDGKINPQLTVLYSDASHKQQTARINQASSAESSLINKHNIISSSSCEFKIEKDIVPTLHSLQL